jgi:hypothetical protein
MIKELRFSSYFLQNLCFILRGDLSLSEGLIKSAGRSGEVACGGGMGGEFLGKKLTRHFI